MSHFSIANMSDTDGTWAQLRDDLWCRQAHPTREAVWDAVFDAVTKGFPYQTVVFGDVKNTLLHLAVRDNQPGVVQRLMAMGMNPANVNTYGWNAMHMAAYHCKLDVCMVLPTHLLGAKSVWGNTPLAIAAKHQVVKIVRWMLDQPCCPLEVTDGLWLTSTRPEAVAIRAAFAARKRWTALRAAWIGAVVL